MIVRQRLLRALGLGAVVALAAVSPAAAVTATDPDDTAGKLDVRKVVVTDTASSVTVTVKTWGSWSTDVLASGQNRLAILFDSDLDGAWDYRGRIIKSSGVLVLLLSGRGNSYEPLPVERPSSQAVSFTDEPLPRLRLLRHRLQGSGTGLRLAARVGRLLVRGGRSRPALAGSPSRSRGRAGRRGRTRCVFPGLRLRESTGSGAGP